MSGRYAHQLANVRFTALDSQAEKKKEQQWVSSNTEITARIKPFEEEKRVSEKKKEQTRK